MEGIRWIIDNRSKYNIRVANLSIGTNDRNINYPLVNAVNAAWDHGIVVVAAAGNSEGRNKGVTSPGISRKIITAGMYDSTESSSGRRYEIRRMGLFNQYVLRPDVLAPGTDIISCLSPNKDIYGLNVTDDNYIEMSGTSMSTPMVSGAIALMLQSDRSLTPNQIKQIIWNCSINSVNKTQGGCELLNIERLISYKRY